MEDLAKIPTEVEYASEFRYRNPIIEDGTIVIAISQSGETADTLAALREAKERGALALGIVNTVGSTIARETDAGIYLHVGPEIGVASTKAFSGQVVVETLLALFIARRKYMSQQVLNEFLTALSQDPGPGAAGAGAERGDQATSRSMFANRENWLFLGRGYNYPVALEGALKLKEISYIHAEGLPAAEMKHGPIALINAGMPVVFIAPRGSAVREDSGQHPGSEGPRREDHRRGQRRGRAHSHGGGSRVHGAGDDRAAAAAADGGAAAVAGVSRGGGAGLQRGQAAEPGEERDGGVMAELSKSQVDKLGARLRAHSHSDLDLRLLDEFRNSFSHTFGVVRQILGRRSVEPVARNIKSTLSIVAKLRRQPKLRLSRIQDIAGCRIVVANIACQNKEVEDLKSDFAGADVKDRRLDPSHGYRAVHVIVKVDEQTFEIQVRTLLQQQWAELSEKASDIIDPEIKYGGDGQGFQVPLMVISRQIAEHEAEEAAFGVFPDWASVTPVMERDAGRN